MGTGYGVGPLLRCSGELQGLGSKEGAPLFCGGERLPQERARLQRVLATQNGAAETLWFETTSRARVHSAIICMCCVFREMLGKYLLL